MDLTFEIHAKIQKPVAEVFDAVCSPVKLSRYFTTGGASAPLREGTTVLWSFADAPEKYRGSNLTFPVQVTKVLTDRLIELEWGASEGGYTTQVRMKFESLGPTDTLVSISESGWRETPAGLAGSYDNCGGWMQMACCLKAFVEYGINLRQGFQ
ncbi:MAG: SRPBCC domain-containing protein [Thermoplasmata archaeon]